MPGRDQRSRNKVDHRGGGRGARAGKKYVEEEDFDAVARRNRDVAQIKRRQQQEEEEEESSDDEPAAAAAAVETRKSPVKKAPQVKASEGSDSDSDIAPIGADQKHQPTRREREAAAKEAAHKAYLEKQAKGETSEFKAQAKRLAEVRARRAAAAKKREQEEAAGEGGGTVSEDGPTVGVQAGREQPNKPTSALAEAMGATTMTAGPRRRGAGKKKGKH
ncbi:RNA processing protein [Perkinsus chesapeaki]|uniref:RNA processing protein n=1 Tax=Perkinsus chesapeaki TaxID=330153 RepID=A0A7J6MJV0_PERCH|nr:RNA processing protein [Perkinsus chesapeaki]